MTVETQPLRLLDARLETRAGLLCKAARAMPELRDDEREEVRQRILEFLRRDLAEHVLLDKHILYPKIVERLGDPLATAPLHYDHGALAWWAEQLEHAELADVNELQRLLYGLHALITVHLSKEEDLYVDAIDSTTWPAA